MAMGISAAEPQPEVLLPYLSTLKRIESDPCALRDTLKLVLYLSLVCEKGKSNYLCA